MNDTWASVADVGPTPEQRLKALADFYKNVRPSTMLREALGYFSNDVLPGTPAIGAPLVKHMVAICVDTESNTMNTDQMTELGLNYISRKDARAIGNPGSHGFRLQESLKFLHLRVVEHSHLKSNRVDSLGPLGNRFGHTRFVTFNELRVILDDFFLQDIETDDPALKGCKHPIVLVGHALRHDVENTQKPGLEYDIAGKFTVVAKVDTQSLARETGVWIPPPGMLTNEIGLRVLIEKLGFQHVNDHTACNDAARTMMCGIHMILPDNLRHVSNPTMQAVADRVEARSKDTSPALYGTVKCCTRCSGRDHSVEECTTEVHCAACSRFDAGPDRDNHVAGHTETFCPHVGRFTAWLRRYKDADLKHQRKGKAFSAELLAGPGPDGHPWSTWYGPWPLAELGEAIWRSTMAKAPKAEVYNLQSALGGLPVPSTGNWVMVDRPASFHGRAASTSSATALAANGSSTPTKGKAASSKAFSPSASVTSSTAPAPVHASAPTPTTARRETRMSDQRGRGQGVVRRGGPSRGRGGRGGGAAGASASALENWGFDG